MRQLFWILVVALAGAGLTNGQKLNPSTSLPPVGTVSVAELRLPTAASKELRIYQRYFDSGDTQNSARHLEKAIRIYPALPAAHHNLGVCYLRQKKFEKAITAFQNASNMDAGFIEPILGLSAALFLLGRYPQAETAARRAHDMDPGNLTACYLLGRTLVAEGSDSVETVDLLHASSAEFTVAHLALAMVLLKRNSPEEAAAELREYMPHSQNKQRVVCMIEKLSEPLRASTCTLE
jgi:tetratricopeptide (TPR) repeat protein